MESARFGLDDDYRDISMPQILLVFDTPIDCEESVEASLLCEGQQFPVLLAR